MSGNRCRKSLVVSYPGLIVNVGFSPRPTPHCWHLCDNNWSSPVARILEEWHLTKSILLKKAVKDDAVVYFHHKNESDNFINHWSWQGHSDRCWGVFAWLSFITWLTSDILPETSLTAFLLTSALVITACPNTFDHLRYRGFEWQSCRAVFKLLQLSSQCLTKRWLSVIICVLPFFLDVCLPSNFFFLDVCLHWSSLCPAEPGGGCLNDRVAWLHRPPWLQFLE